MTRHRAVVGAIAVSIATGSTAAVLTPSASARSLNLGFTDGVFTSPSAAERSQWLDKAVEEQGAQTVRLTVRWSDIAPSRPARPRDPGDRAYRWGGLDGGVRDASKRGLRVLISFTGAPGWAEGANRPSGARPGTWRPSVSAVADFSRALATRYSGGFPDPTLNGVVLPRVEYYQVWNEPNLDYYLSPQWTNGGGRPRLASPDYYREMLNAAYPEFKAVRRDNVVFAAGTAPFGDPGRGGERVMPALFLRELFCLAGRKDLNPTRCPDPVHLDGIDHHPYGVGGPRRDALSADNVTVPDLKKLVRPLEAARRSERVLPGGEKRVWITEMGWDTRPPDPDGVPERKAARWLEDSFRILSDDGASTILPLQIRDSAPDPNFPSTHQGGTYFRDGRPKDGARAFRFPFVPRRVDKDHVRVFGRSPGDGTIQIQARQKGNWRTIERLRGQANKVFAGEAELAADRDLRARVDGRKSLTWPGSKL